MYLRDKVGNWFGQHKYLFSSVCTDIFTDEWCNEFWETQIDGELCGVTPNQHYGRIMVQ